MVSKGQTFFSEEGQEGLVGHYASLTFGTPLTFWARKKGLTLKLCRYVYFFNIVNRYSLIMV